MSPRLKLVNDPEGVVWRKLAAALLAGSMLFVAPACEANVETEDGLEEEGDEDVDLDEDEDLDDEDEDDDEDDVDIDLDEDADLDDDDDE